MRQSYPEGARPGDTAPPAQAEAPGDAAPPQAAAPQQVAAPPRIRPAWVWIIALLSWYGSLYSVVTELKMMLGFVPVPVSLQRYVAGLTLLDHVVALALGAMWCAGATLLWMLRRQALGWLLASFLLGGADFARHVVTRGIIGSFASLGALGTIVAVLVFAVRPILTTTILAYVVSLYRRKALE